MSTFDSQCADKRRCYCDQVFTGGKSIGDNARGLAWNSRIGTGFPEASSSVFSSVILAPQLSHQPSQPCNWPNQVCVLLPGYFFCFWRAGYVQCFLHTWKPLSRNPLTGIQTYATEVRNVDLGGSNLTSVTHCVAGDVAPTLSKPQVHRL